MKNIFQSVIKTGSYDLPDMLYKIDSYHIQGRLSDQERDELYALARGGADPTRNLDLLAKVLELEDRVTMLELPKAEAPSMDYAVGKWYRNGDRVTFESANYTCIAPDGVVCIWSPSEYPAYWQEDHR